MTWLLSLDPGLRGCGLALFHDDKLHTAWYSKNLEKKARGPTAWDAMASVVERDVFLRLPREVWVVDRLATEVPQVYRGRSSKGDPADLLELTGVVGAVARAIPSRERRHYLPREWKGQVPKEIHVPRILNILAADETQRIEPVIASLRHNQTDGIGIGLFDLRRM
jgi:hypothetical protein